MGSGIVIKQLPHVINRLTTVIVNRSIIISLSARLKR